MSAGPGVDRQRWARLHIFEQMGNIDSEVGRTFNAKRRGNMRDAELAMGRALDLFDATSETLLEQRSPRLKEILRAKEQFLWATSDERATAEDLSTLERYFMHFAIAARLHR